MNRLDATGEASQDPEGAQRQLLLRQAVASFGDHQGAGAAVWQRGVEKSAEDMSTPHQSFQQPSRQILLG
ncbi:MAG: hypothetical protein ING46_18760 [Rubrivivax sp.]|jgi:hypothetical protein|nr:hypothetical protein [Rubrivivax sp.]